MSNKEFIPFTYLIRFIPENLYYYGVKYGKGCHPDDLWTTYFTSSKTIERLIEVYGKDAFEYEVRKTFPNDVNGAILWERNVLKKIFKYKKSNDKFINYKFINENAAPALTPENSAKGAKMQWLMYTEEQKDAVRERARKWGLKSSAENKRLGRGMFHDKKMQSAAGKKGSSILKEKGFFQSEKWKESSSRADTTWITNGVNNKRYNIDNVEDFLNENREWRYGTTKTIVMPDNKGCIYVYTPDGSKRTRVNPNSEKYHDLISQGYWSKDGKHGVIPENMKNHKNGSYTDQQSKAWESRRAKQDKS